MQGIAGILRRDFLLGLWVLNCSDPYSNNKNRLSSRHPVCMIFDAVPGLSAEKPVFKY